MLNHKQPFSDAADAGLGTLRRQRIAIVHDWLTAFAGSEKVVEQLLIMFPEADLFALVDHLPAEHRPFLNGKLVRTSFLQNIPFSRTLFRKLLWLLPAAIESLDLSGYDIVISSSHAVAKGVITGPNQLHVCYCHTPIRYAWDLQHEYLRQAGLTSGISSCYARVTLHYIRMWDVRTAHGVDHFVANSNFVARRIEKVYRRSATVVHPPVAIDRFVLSERKQEYYLTASRLVPYKRIDLIIKAFAQMRNRKLIVVGDGPDMPACRKHATANVDFLGFQSDTSLQHLMSKAKAFVFAAEEDFGITVVEAQASGTPVICFGRGGVLDSVIPGRTGFFFEEQTPESIVRAVDVFENTAPLDPYEIRSSARRFSSEEFRRQMTTLIVTKWNQHQTAMFNPTIYISDETSKQSAAIA